ncbi:hypothetical protein ECZU41_13820 [Escherichia coli]|nr:hypothetical protein ECZU41_13820 [Escherichia coli]
MIFPGDSGYLKMGNCLMSYSKRGSNALIKFDYTDTLQIKYANHGSTMTLNTQGTAYAGVTAQLWGNPAVLLFMKSVLMVALICSMRRKIPITPIC